MDKAIETMLAASMIFFSTAGVLVTAGKILEGALCAVIGVGLIFARGYMKFPTE